MSAPLRLVKENSAHRTLEMASLEMDVVNQSARAIRIRHNGKAGLCGLYRMMDK